MDVLPRAAEPATFWDWIERWDGYDNGFEYEVEDEDKPWNDCKDYLILEHHHGEKEYRLGENGMMLWDFKCPGWSSEKA